jgi:hypothetical protein
LVLDSFDRVYDGAVLKALQRYARKQAFRHPSPEDFLAEFREGTSEQAEAQLRLALFDRGWSDNALLDLDCADSCSVLIARRGSLHLPVDLEFWGTEGEHYKKRWDAQKDLEWVDAPEGMSVERVVLDPEHKLGLDEDLANNAICLRIPKAKRIFERGAYWTQLTLGLAP